MNKKLIVATAAALLTSACSSGVGSWDMFKRDSAMVLSGDESQVTLYDPRGIVPSGAQTTANKYCASYGKTAEWQSQGGTSSDCVSLQSNYCATYSCK